MAQKCKKKTKQNKKMFQQTIAIEAINVLEVKLTYPFKTGQFDCLYLIRRNQKPLLFFREAYMMPC